MVNAYDSPPFGLRGPEEPRTGRDPVLPVSVVVPTLHAAGTLAGALEPLAGRVAEIVVADGGSADGTPELAAAIGARILAAPRGRGSQLACGAAAARQDWLLFLHADTVLADGWDQAVRDFLSIPANAARAAYFRFTLDDESPQARRLERWVERRCRWLGLPYGDQGLLISRRLYEALGGFRPLPLMEDVDLVRRIGRARLTALPVAAVTSAARWREEGWTRRSTRNLTCLGLWFTGVSADRIARLYGRRAL